jgi:ATP-dependent DNA helicase RecG
VVCPRIEESEPARQLKAVLREHETLQSRFAPHEVGLLHGRLAPEEKERVMTAFRAGTLKVLLATTVIEVGLDVPNATVMLIENADTFGLAQLHQLRGRIGRGRNDAYCILIAGRESKEARERLAVLAETHDGFRIAEADLAQRGPGEMLGKDQSGLPPFKFGDLIRDASLIERARALAADCLNGAPESPTQVPHPSPRPGARS